MVSQMVKKDVFCFLPQGANGPDIFGDDLLFLVNWCPDLAPVLVLRPCPSFRFQDGISPLGTRSSKESLGRFAAIFRGRRKTKESLRGCKKEDRLFCCFALANSHWIPHTLRTTSGSSSFTLRVVTCGDAWSVLVTR